MQVIYRFEVDASWEDEFRRQAVAASRFLEGREGCESVELMQNIDDPALWVLVSRWANVGSYRRAFNGYEAKVILTPLLCRTVEEPTAYAQPGDVGENIPRAR